MNHLRSRAGTGVAAAVAALAALAGAAPASAAPDFDEQGYLDSTARCTDTAVVFGATESSRVAICPGSDGGYQYRGVRIADGAKLIIAASKSGAGGYRATSGGVTYTVSSSALVVTDGSRVLREEPMLDFHGADSGAAATKQAAPPEEPAAEPTDTPAPATSETPSTPLPPPLPAEVGHVGS